MPGRPRPQQTIDTITVGPDVTPGHERVRVNQRPHLSNALPSADVSGLEDCRELRRDPGTAAVPIIVLTAGAQRSDIEAGYEAGANDYIVKPFSPRDLAERVQALLG